MGSDNIALLLESKLFFRFRWACRIINPSLSSLHTLQISCFSISWTSSGLCFRLYDLRPGPLGFASVKRFLDLATIIRLILTAVLSFRNIKYLFVARNSFLNNLCMLWFVLWPEWFLVCKIWMVIIKRNRKNKKNRGNLIRIY